jgi:hypothetical protein
VWLSKTETRKRLCWGSYKAVLAIHSPVTFVSDARHLAVAGALAAEAFERVIPIDHEAEME